MKYSSGYLAGLFAFGLDEYPVLRRSLQTSSTFESVDALDALKLMTKSHKYKMEPISVKLHCIQ